MGWLKKEEVYDKKKGKFVSKHPKIKPLTREEQFGTTRQGGESRRQRLKREYNEAYEKAKRKGNIARAKRLGHKAGSRRWYDSISAPPSSPRRRTKPRVGTVSKKRKRPSVGTVSKRRKPPKVFDNFGFDMV